MSLTPEQRASFERDGFVIVRGLFDAEQMRAAREEVEKITYGKSFADYVASHTGDEKKGDYELSAQGEHGRSQFPTGLPILDGLLENERYLDCFADCLESEDLHYCNGHLFVRSGPDDTRFSAEKWQGYHIDDNTCSFLPPNPNWRQYAYVNSWVMLHDIEEDGAPLQVIPGSHRQIADLLPGLVARGDAIRGFYRDIREIEEFAPPISVTGKAGDVLLYSSYLVHAAIGFENKGSQRAVWTMSLGRGEDARWTKFSNPYVFGERAHTIPFWEKTSPRVRSLFGWPPPGHSYYTPETLELLSAWFPEMDLEPYRTPAFV
jgi:hypothetical protein